MCRFIAHGALSLILSRPHNRAALVSCPLNFSSTEIKASGWERAKCFFQFPLQCSFTRTIGMWEFCNVYITSNFIWRLRYIHFYFKLRSRIRTRDVFFWFLTVFRFWIPWDNLLKLLKLFQGCFNLNWKTFFEFDCSDPKSSLGWRLWCIRHTSKQRGAAEHNGSLDAIWHYG